ncbi:MAG: RsmD family RNA methyltransferase, partial [Aigarchaeota archaeon]|nr:RsmD family RNA methyltransferase [Aigarchaeota archaeon]
WSFTPRRLPLITAEVAEDVLEAMERGQGSVSTSLDLWLSKVELILARKGLLIGSVEVSREELGAISNDKRTVFSVTSDGLRPVEVRAVRYYKLVNCGRGRAPTLEIDGVHMHRVKDVSPTEDAIAKVRLLGRLNDRKVLDTCTGLGYTAIEAVRRGAEVVTVELDENVLTIAETNPWSAELGGE